MSISSVADAQDRQAPAPDPDAEEAEETEEEEAEEAAEEEADEPAKATPAASKLRIEAGAPRPGAQTPGISAPPAPPAGAPPAPPTIKVGGAFILLYHQPINMTTENRLQTRPRPEPFFETFRAALLLDSKIDRYGVHIEFRARDKRIREFYEGTSWLEEIYGSVDILKADHALGPMTLKVGKSYAQFGMFWDDSFYGSTYQRDGLKLDPNYGLSLEGTMGKRMGAKYFAQYFVMDGGTNTSNPGRDVISNAAPASGYPPINPAGLNSTPGGPAGTPIGPTSVPTARKRNMFVLRVEPFIAVSPTTVFKIGGSVQNFTADFGPTVDQENVFRTQGDATMMLGGWLKVFGEYTYQKGRTSLTNPYGSTQTGFSPTNVTNSAISPTAWGPSLPIFGNPTGSSDNVRYALAGVHLKWKGVTLRYNYSRVDYKDITFRGASIVDNRILGVVVGNEKMDIHEQIHLPGITVAATQQLFLMVEFPIYQRKVPDFNYTTVNPVNRMPIPFPGGAKPTRDMTLDRAVVVTLHARI